MTSRTGSQFSTTMRNGDLTPKRRLYVPHQAWGLSLNPSREEMVISVQQLSMLAIYRREANGMDAPVRVVKGPHTGMADPHGVRWDVAHHEIVVASHGNSTRWSRIPLTTQRYRARPRPQAQAEGILSRPHSQFSATRRWGRNTHSHDPGFEHAIELAHGNRH